MTVGVDTGGEIERRGGEDLDVLNYCSGGGRHDLVINGLLIMFSIIICRIV